MHADPILLNTITTHPWKKSNSNVHAGANPKMRQHAITNLQEHGNQTSKKKNVEIKNQNQNNFLFCASFGSGSSHI